MAKEFSAWPPRVEGEPRINPIIPLVDELHTAISLGDGSLIEHRLIRLGNGLIPHAQNHDDAISMLDFVQIGTEVRLKKNQFWSFDIEDGYKKYQIERTDVWNGSGVSLQLNKYEMDKFILGVTLQKDWCKYYLMLGTTLVPWGYFKQVKNDVAYESFVIRLINKPRTWKRK